MMWSAEGPRQAWVYARWVHVRSTSLLLLLMSSLCLANPAAGEAPPRKDMTPKPMHDERVKPKANPGGQVASQLSADTNQEFSKNEAQTLTHQKNGQMLHASGQYVNAALEFLAAYQITPFPRYLFSAATSYRKAQNIALSISNYELFVRVSSENSDYESLRAEAKGYLHDLYIIREKEEALRRPAWKKPWFWGVIAGGVVLGATVLTIGIYYGTQDQRETIRF